MEFLSFPIPQWLLFMIIALLGVPSLILIVLRVRVFAHLSYLNKQVTRLINNQSVGRLPDIVRILEYRYETARRNLEEVNTSALVDQIYSKERVWIWSCDQSDYFCRVLPNLLLVFGLLGTFFGITINLLSLSTSIGNGFAIDNIISELRVSLQGMSIAFLSSLFALFFSGLLTTFNAVINTGLARYQLLSSLEDYLDNIYLPSLEHTRMDTAVEHMTNTLDSFLTRFGITVREAVETSLGDEVVKIVDGTLKTTDLAEAVYAKFLDSSGNIAAGSEIFREAAQIFQSSEFANTLKKANADLSKTQTDLSQSASILHASTQTFEDTISHLNHLKNNVDNFEVIFKQILQTTIRYNKEILEEFQQVQATFSEGTDQIKSTALSGKSDLEKTVQNSVSELKPIQRTVIDSIRKVNDTTVASNRSILKLMEEKFQHKNSDTAEIVSHLQVMINDIKSLKGEIIRIESFLQKIEANNVPATITNSIPYSQKTRIQNLQKSKSSKPYSQ